MHITCRLNEKKTEVTFTTITAALGKSGDALVVTDEHVAPLLPETPRNLLVLTPGESGKHLGSIEKIIDAALRLGLGRDGRIIGLGGGVICDMAAFAASIYMRGIAVQLIPTTLLAMVDASLGGKTGVDFQDIKNIIGSFHPAEEVLICADMLPSLPEREFYSGLAELIKHGLLMKGGSLLRELEGERSSVTARDPRVLEKLVYDSLKVKESFITADPQERTGLRAQLNFGHTFGHALETLTGLSRWSHGEAVAWGMARALEAGVRAGITDPGYAERAAALITSYGFDIEYRIPEELLDEYMKILSRDKKQQQGQVRFILQRRAGETLLSPLEPGIVREVVSTSRKS